jgi:hypothetical protein
MQRPSEDTSRIAQFQVLLEAENIAIGVIVLIAAIVAVNAFLF